MPNPADFPGKRGFALELDDAALGVRGGLWGGRRFARRVHLSASVLRDARGIQKETSDAGGSEVDGTASLAELVLDGAPLGFAPLPIAALG